MDPPAEILITGVQLVKGDERILFRPLRVFSEQYATHHLQCLDIFEAKFDGTMPARFMAVIEHSGLNQLSVRNTEF